MPEQSQENELFRILASLTPEKAGMLVAQLERQKLEGKGGAHVDVVLTAVRKLVRNAATPRWPTPQRLFCVAFEDFLVDQRTSKMPCRILRANINPVWSWLMEKGLALRGPELTRQIAKATLDRNEPLKEKRVQELQTEAAEVMIAALEVAQKGGQTAVVTLIGNEDIAADMREMALLLAKPHALAPLRTLIPRGHTDLGEGTINAFRQEYDLCVAEAPELAPFTIVLAMNRLTRPWEAMALVRAVSRQSQDRLLSETDLGIAGELLIADLEDLAAQTALVRPDTFDGDALAKILERITAASAGMAREMGIKRDGKWGARIQKARALAANSVQALLGRTAQEVLGAFPMARGGSFAKGPRKPDLAHSPDPTRVARAVRWAKLMASVKPMSAGLGFQSAVQDAQDEIDATLRQYADGVLTEMRGGDPDVRATGLAYMEAQAQVVGAMFSNEAATLLRRRAAAALAA